MVLGQRILERAAGFFASLSVRNGADLQEFKRQLEEFRSGGGKRKMRIWFSDAAELSPHLVDGVLSAAKQSSDEGGDGGNRRVEGWIVVQGKRPSSYSSSYSYYLASSHCPFMAFSCTLCCLATDSHCPAVGKDTRGRELNLEELARRVQHVSSM